MHAGCRMRSRRAAFDAAGRRRTMHTECECTYGKWVLVTLLERMGECVILIVFCQGRSRTIGASWMRKRGGLMAFCGANRKSVTLACSERRLFALFVRILIVRSASGVVDAL